MKIHRIYAVFLRYLYYARHSVDRYVDVFYWPLVDLILWGMASLYFSSLAPDTRSIVLMIVSGIVLWYFVFRVQAEIAMNLLEDLWSRNFVNFFVSPLAFSEWISGFMILGVMKGVITFLFAGMVAFMLYAVNVFAFGFHMLVFAALLMMNGWWLGFFIAGFIIRFGMRVQSLSWSAVWLIAPFAAIYYPVAVLPEWAQTIAHLVPASYVFEAMRALAQSGALDSTGLYISFFLNIFYIVVGFLFLRWSFGKRLERGLIKIYL